MPVSTIVTPQADTARLDRRRARYDAQRVVWRETRLPRVAYCGRFASDRHEGVQLKVTDTAEGRRAGFSGLQTCGSVWACPVCSEKINAGRQADLTAGLERWLEQGKAVLFGTVTMRHHKGHKLEQLLEAISPSWNRTTSGAGVAWNGGKHELGDKARFGIAGYVRLLEVKHGANGWHPHIHFLLFLERPLSAGQLADLEARMFARWEKALADRGFSVLKEHGIDLRTVNSAQLADYFAKNTYAGPEPWIERAGSSTGAAAYEVTGSQSKQAGKGGRTPFQILADLVQHGELSDLELWHEWERVSTGRRQLTWSRGMRDKLELEVELTDEQLAEDDSLEGIVLAEWSVDEWREGRLGYLRADLLEAAEAGTLEQLVHRWEPPPG